MFVCSLFYTAPALAYPTLLNGNFDDTAWNDLSCDTGASLIPSWPLEFLYSGVSELTYRCNLTEFISSPNALQVIMTTTTAGATQSAISITQRVASVDREYTVDYMAFASTTADGTMEICFMVLDQPSVETAFVNTLGGYYDFFNEVWRDDIFTDPDSFGTPGQGFLCTTPGEADWENVVIPTFPGNTDGGSTYLAFMLRPVSFSTAADINDSIYLDDIDVLTVNTSNSDISGFTEKFGNAMLWIIAAFMMYAFGLSLYEVLRTIKTYRHDF